jgi:hypothetical protein
MAIDQRTERLLGRDHLFPERSFDDNDPRRIARYTSCAVDSC